MVHCLVCWKCDGRAGPNHYTLEMGGATCGLCGSRNPLTMLRRLPLGAIRESHVVHVCFGPDTDRDGGMRFNVIRRGNLRLIGVKTVDTEATFIRMLVYLGATEEQMAEYHRQRNSWGQGSVDVTLQPNRKNLLGIDWSLLR